VKNIIFFFLNLSGNELLLFFKKKKKQILQLLLLVSQYKYREIMPLKFDHTIQLKNKIERQGEFPRHKSLQYNYCFAL
jgi:hypothetical protein